ncbi:hypothetical protein I6A84_33300 [Frankia sp. CNm7]|uniref:Uncharacterized protein n=1 Tax=Frankia nepalensis TaxID=1836974 RepID=A0A937RKB4_9ACTN|nr:hypothetical protein [Frankia nepalensis]MBL7496866.1 hypothetical protein [Frankia nepalensis]MBL7512066.1 hypothetical protein [Frankia nepalensis]MBL7522833.1 hypothetical protein [Frankia nepalensis]MBL7630475.1 hypothetical protein [Frankia nepalensis]
MHQRPSDSGDGTLGEGRPGVPATPPPLGPALYDQLVGTSPLSQPVTGPHGFPPLGVPRRPLGLLGALRGAFAAIRRHPTATLGVATVGAIVVETIYTVTYLTVPPLSEDMAEWGDSALFSADVTLQCMLSGVIAVVLAGARSGRRVEPDAAAGRAARRLPGLFVIAMLTTLTLIPRPSLGLRFIVLVATLWLGTLFCLAGPAYVVEGGSLGEALSRSRELVKGRGWRTLGIVLATNVLGNIAGWGYFALIDELVPSSYLPPATAGYLLRGLLAVPYDVAVYSMLAAVFALLYLDRTDDADRRGTPPAAWPAGQPGPGGGVGGGWPAGPSTRSGPSTC